MAQAKKCNVMGLFSSIYQLLQCCNSLAYALPRLVFSISEMAGFHQNIVQAWKK